MKRFGIAFPYVVFGAIMGMVVWSNLGEGASSSEPVSAPATARRGTARLDDVVCNMEVNEAWGIQSEYGGEVYHFCTKQCRAQFEADPRSFLTAACTVCQSPLAAGQVFEATYLGRPYSLCSADHRTQFKRDPASYFMHTMWGIPSWLYYASIAIVLVLSFGVFDWLGRRNRRTMEGAGTSREGGSPRARTGRSHRGGSAVSPGLLGLSAVSGSAISLPVLGTDPGGGRADRFDLLRIGWVGAALRSRFFRFVAQAIFVFLFAVTIAAGLFGNQNPALNIAPILTWTIWWALLIVLILFAGKAWCYVCPWDAISGWAEKLSFWKKSDTGLSLGLKWPRIIRNVALATILFVGLTWIELGFGVTMKPRVTAWLGIGMLGMALVSVMLFDRKSFCRYGCLVGRVSGLYAMFGGVEVRSRSAAVCKSCGTKECVKGSESAYGCPTFLYPGGLKANTYCIQCMECVQACPHDNMAVNLRPWGSDLATEGRPRTDEAYLALLMLAITGFHGLTMTPAWGELIEAIRGSAGMGRILGFSTGMALLMLGPIGIYGGLVAISMRWGRRDALKPLTYRDYFVRYAYALLPIALFYHIAHNLEHLLMEGPKVVAMASDPFGWGWNLFGTAGWSIPPLISLEMLWIVQVLLVLIGHVYSLWVAQRTSMRLFGSARSAFRSQLPMLVGMICFSVFSLWLLKQPMEMRTSAM